MIPLNLPQPVVLLWLFVLGAVVGSFLNVCIYRLPQHESLWDQLRGLNHPPSSCPWCQKRILANDNIPIIGWLRLGGRCRFCRHAIPMRYALIEFFNGLLWVVLYVMIVPAGITAKIETSALYSPLGALAQPGLTAPSIIWLVNAEYIYFLILAEALLVATFIDYDLMTIPDGVTVPAMIIGVIGATILGAPTLWPAWLPAVPSWLSAHPHWHGLISSLAGLVVGGGTVWIVRILGQWVFRREAMGFGDVTLMATIGAYLGWQPSLIVFLLVGPLCMIAATLVTRSLQFSRPIPFGPYLSMGALLVVLCWNRWSSRYRTVFDLGSLLPLIFILMGMLLVPILVLARSIKRYLGIPDNPDDPDESEEWKSGDKTTSV